MPPSKPENAGTLRRGSACLSCRRRKLKCDGLRPVCQQCTKMRRTDECQYDDSKKKSRTQMLREKLAMLEEKVRELESDASGSNHSHSPYTSSRGSSVPNSAYDEFNQNPYSQLPSLPVDVSSWLDTAPPYASQDGFDTIWPEIGPSSSSNSPSITGTQATGQMSRPSTLGNPLSALGHNEGFHQFSSTSNCLSSSGWDATQPLPYETHSFLLGAFMAHKNQCYFFSDMNRFGNISALPHQQGPHPALMNAIYLLACHFTKTPLCSQFEEIFLTQTLNEITVALHNSNHLVDVIQASTLLAVYYYFNGRVLEGYRHAFSSARLAIGLGLHQVRRVGNTGFNSIEVADAEEKIAAFWQVFLVDRCWSSANGLLSAIPDGKTSSTRITTPLPTILTSANPEQHSFNSSIFDLFEPHTSLFHAISLATPAFKAMAAAVYDRSSRLANSLRQDESYWSDHRLCQIALQRVQATVWSSTNSSELWSVGDNKQDVVDMFAVNTMMHASTIYLQTDTDFLESTYTTDALSGIVALAGQINVSDYPYLDPMIGVCWSGITNILLQRIKSFKERKAVNFDEFSSTIPFIKGCLNTLLGYLKPLEEFAPLAGNMEKGIRENYQDYLEYPPPPQYEPSMLFSVV